MQNINEVSLESFSMAANSVDVEIEEEKCFHLPEQKICLSQSS